MAEADSNAVAESDSGWDATFWNKCARAAKNAGREVIEKALWLYYAFHAPGTPGWAKAVIAGGLAYFISPLDAIPDLIPIAGYSDDLGILVGAVAVVALYIDDEVKAKAKAKLQDWGMVARA
jgi:uncharacterized membrane protein YkvA (DUF1232 family)